MCGKSRDFSWFLSSSGQRLARGERGIANGGRVVARERPELARAVEKGEEGSQGRGSEGARKRGKVEDREWRMKREAAGGDGGWRGVVHRHALVRHTRSNFVCWSVIFCV